MESRHPLGSYIKPNISFAPVPVTPIKTQRTKNVIGLNGATHDWQFPRIQNEESESANKS